MYDMTLFFIGNGFDLNIGLKTQFKDVLHSYIAKTTEDDEVIDFFKNSMNEDFEIWADFEEKMGLYSDEIQKRKVK